MWIDYSACIFMQRARSSRVPTRNGGWRSNGAQSLGNEGF